MKRMIVFGIISLLLMSSFAYAQQEQQEPGFFTKIIGFLIHLFTKKDSQEEQVNNEVVEEQLKEIKEIQEDNTQVEEQGESSKTILDKPEEIQKITIQTVDSQGKDVASIKEALAKGELRNYNLENKDFTISLKHVNPPGNADFNINGKGFTLYPDEYKHINGLLVRHKGTKFDYDTSTNTVITKVDLEIYDVGIENTCEPKVECIKDELIWYSCDNSRTIKIDTCEEPVLATGAICEDVEGKVIDCNKLEEIWPDEEEAEEG